MIIDLTKLRDDPLAMTIFAVGCLATASAAGAFLIWLYGIFIEDDDEQQQPKTNKNIGNRVKDGEFGPQKRKFQLEPSDMPTAPPKQEDEKGPNGAPAPSVF